MPRLAQIGPGFEGVPVSRFTQIGPGFDNVTVDPTVLPDVPIVEVSAVHSVVKLTVPPFDPATVSVPVAIHAAYYATAPDPALDPASALAAASFAGQAPFAGPGDVSIAVAGIAPGIYAKVLTFAEFPS